VQYIQQARGFPSEEGFEAFKHGHATPRVDPSLELGLAGTPLTGADGQPLRQGDAANTEHARAVARGAKQERDDKAAWQARERANAERRRTGARVQLDDVQAAQLSAQRQREVEAERTARALLDAGLAKADAAAAKPTRTRKVAA
jgi:hypothetical protein